MWWVAVTLRKRSKNFLEGDNESIASLQGRRRALGRNLGARTRLIIGNSLEIVSLGEEGSQPDRECRVSLGEAMQFGLYTFMRLNGFTKASRI